MLYLQTQYINLTTSVVNNGVEIKLDAVDGTDSTQEIIGGTNVTVTRTDDDTITISSIDTDTQLDKDDIDALDIERRNSERFQCKFNRAFWCCIYRQ